MLNSLPTVSCVVAAFNAERFLGAALDSIFAQRGAILDVILVDDGSTDRTGSIAAGYDGPIRIITQANAGTTVARNRGLEVAHGEFITFQDADDLCPADKLQLQLAAFAEEPTLELCAAHVQNFRGDMLPEGDPIPGYNTEMLIRREVFDRLGPFVGSLRHAARLEWMLRARRAKTKERLLPQTLMYRRLHETNISFLGANQSLHEYLHVLHASLRQRA